MNLDIHIYGWVIEDGNYGHFVVGETREFALEFYAPLTLTKTNRTEKSLEKAEGYSYDVIAQVVSATDDICVIDFGLLAYSESSLDLNAGNCIGDFLQGNILLDVDPFFYFERLAKLPSSPPLIYKWRIDSIEQDTTPWMRENGVYVRDETRRSFQSVGATSELVSSDISAAHVLHCATLNTPARREFSSQER
jgi:hypothetical protein